MKKEKAVVWGRTVFLLKSKSAGNAGLRSLRTGVAWIGPDKKKVIGQITLEISALLHAWVSEKASVLLIL